MLNQWRMNLSLRASCRLQSSLRKGSGRLIDLFKKLRNVGRKFLDWIVLKIDGTQVGECENRGWKYMYSLTLEIEGLQVTESIGVALGDRFKEFESILVDLYLDCFGQQEGSGPFDRSINDGKFLEHVPKEFG